MKKQLLLGIALTAGFYSLINAICWPWESCSPVRQGVEKAASAVKEGFQENIQKPIETHVINPISDAIAKKKEYGKKLKDGAGMLESAAPEFRKRIDPLQAMPAKLAEGRTKMEAAIANIHKTNTDVTNQLNSLDKKTEMLAKMGQKSLVTEIRSALTDLKTALTKLADTNEKGECKGGVLCDLLKATNESATYSTAQINKLLQQINELDGKVHAGQGGCIGDLPKRMRSTGDFLAI